MIRIISYQLQSYIIISILPRKNKNKVPHDPKEDHSVPSRFPSWRKNKTVADPLGLAVSFLTF